MTGLVRSEVRRLLARRLVRRIALLALVLIAAGGALAFVRTDSLSTAAFEQRQAEADRLEAQREADVSACLREHGVSGREEVSAEVADACFTSTEVDAADPRFHRSRLHGILQGIAGVLVLVGWLIGASMVGAEFASRGMTTTLTWEPRRLRVIATKAGVAMAAVAVLAAAILALTTLAMLPALFAHGAPAADEPSWATMLGAGLRGVALAVMTCGIGFGIATAARNTGAALGAGFVYIVVIENILGSALEDWRRWLLLGNLIVFVSGKADPIDIPGRSVEGAALFLSTVAVALLVAGALSFRRRDLA